MALTKKKAFLLIIASWLAAWLLANVGIAGQKLEMAAIANLFGPPLCGIVSLLLFAVIDYFFKNVRTTIVLLLTLMNLGVGIFIRCESLAISNRAMDDLFKIHDNFKMKTFTV